MKHFSELAIQLIADAKIKQAYDDGKFDKLPGFGKPIRFAADGTLEPWFKSRLRNERLQKIIKHQSKEKRTNDR